MFTVRLDPGEPDAAATHATTLAGLPQSFRIASVDGTGGVDIAMISGRSADWPHHAVAAIHAGARALYVTGVNRSALAVDRAAVEDLARHADRIGAPVVVVGPWASHPAVADAAPRVRNDLDAVTFAHGLFTTANGGHGAGDLVDGMALLRTLGLPVADGDVLARGGSYSEFIGSAGSATVHLAVVASRVGVAGGQLWLVAPDRQWHVSLPDPSVAAAPQVTRWSHGGGRVRPAYHETADRSAWRLLHAALSRRAPVGYGLAELCADLDTLRSQTDPGVQLMTSPG
jgi:hypothetical protein